MHKHCNMKKLLILSVSLFAFSASSAQKDQVEKAMQEKYMKEHGNDGMAKLQDFMANMSNAETRPVYKFPITMTMRITDYVKGVKKEPSDIKYHINATEETFAFVGKENKSGSKEMVIVYDNKNNVMVMLDEQKRSYMAMNVNAFMSAEMQARKAQGVTKGTSNLECSKSGKTKNIQGYLCEEYVCIDKEKDSKTEVWVTDKVPVNIAKSAKGQAWATYFHGLEGMNGMMMEGKFYEKGQLEATMEVTEMNEKANHSISLSSYKKTDMFGGR